MNNISGSTRSLHEFRQTLRRSLTLAELSTFVELGDVKRVDGKPLDLDPNDLVRAAVVLAVSAMDAYFTDRFVEMLIPFLQQKGASDGLVKLLADARLDTRQALEMLSMKRPYRRVRSLVEAYLERFTAQRFGAIDSLFWAYGLKDFSKCVERTIGRKTIRRSIELLVLRRHQIVHDGDLNSHGKLVPIDGLKMFRRIQDIQKFVEGAESFLNKIIKLDKPPKPLVEMAIREALRP